MNYFSAIAYRANELDKLGESYLKQFEFLSNNEILDRLWKKANQLFTNANKDFDAIPEWAADFLDGWVPYAPSKNGSLYHALGISVVSRDAHLRNLLERAEGRETKELNFPILAEKDIVEQLTTI